MPYVKIDVERPQVASFVLLVPEEYVKAFEGKFYFRPETLDPIKAGLFDEVNAGLNSYDWEAEEDPTFWDVVGTQVIEEREAVTWPITDAREDLQKVRKPAPSLPLPFGETDD